MKPFKSFLFIITSLLLLTAIPLICPKKKLVVSGIELRIFNFDFLADNHPTSIQKAENPNDIVLSEAKTTTSMKVESENAQPTPKIVENFPHKTEGKKNQQEIHLSNTDIDIPSSATYKWAEQSSKFSQTDRFEKPLRILYYGDSQIENDRITSVFRKILQERFGGIGRGLIPVQNIYNSANNFTMTTSGNWESESVKKVTQNRLDLGLLCEAFKVRNSGTGEKSLSTSWVKIKSIKENPENGFTVLRIFYRASGKSQVSVTLNADITNVNELSACEEICEMHYNLVCTPQEVELRFSTSSEITIYGLNLESPTGIMVDNIALRGLSSPEFTKIDTIRLQQMARLLNPSFIIMQYGVNVVPNMTSDYSFYKKKLNKELECLQKTIPGIPVLLVGVSDMACRISGLLESYPNIEDVLNIQKEVALENGCAFWNLFESMGGRGSMINWVESQPPLGNKDYVHYTSLGAEKVGTLFARQFIKALEPGSAIASLVNEP
jgi:hypothetical protein